MTQANFQRAMPIILTYEGGFVDNPADPGGATNHGITLATYSAYIGRPATVEELQEITPADVATIYQAHYWGATGDALPSGVDLMYFDAAVNNGPGNAAKFLQGAVGATPDGIVGPATLAAVATAAPADIIRKMGNARDAFYRSLKTWPTFGNGWTARLNSVTATSYAWANGA